MAVYFQTDIKIFDDGELDLDTGDLAVASPLQSQRQLLINCFSTTRGGYLYDPLTGWGCERYFGRPNSPMTYEIMKRDIDSMLNQVEDLVPEDVYYEITRLDEESLAIIIRHKGEMVDEDDEIGELVLSWKLALGTGQIQLWEPEEGV